MLTCKKNVGDRFCSRTVYFHGFQHFYKNRLALLLLIAITVTFIFYTQKNIRRSEEDYFLNPSLCPILNKKRVFLLKTPTCQIPNHDPYSSDIKKYILNLSYIYCDKNKGLLTYIEKTPTAAILHVNQSLLLSYSYFLITCCFSVVTRNNNSDNLITISDCVKFEKSVQLDDNISVIKTRCGTVLQTNLYTNVHVIINHKKIKYSKTDSRKKLNVILLGIDSMSKLNLARTMPKTFDYLENNKMFINLRGYTKIGDNTFPNVGAILTGRTVEQIFDLCRPNIEDANNCDLIWTHFKSSNYVTAYAEDETSISTFNYNRKGFVNPPTDFYFRPYFLAAETLPSFKVGSMFTCTGPENTGERVMHIIRDFMTTFSSVPKFGLFWMNTFSHDDINAPSMMDEKFLHFLSEIQPLLRDTIFLFFSDHGFRFGDIRYTYTGWFEERVPFIYVYLPYSFKRAQPNAYRNFLLNSKRLTSPYDIYMTLQDVLKMGDNNTTVRVSQGCPKCHSLFREVDVERTCSDAGIDGHWCVCSGYDPISENDKMVQEVGRFVVTYINNLIHSYENGSNETCAFYSIDEIVTAAEAKHSLNKKLNNNRTVSTFLVMVKTRPAAMFEATVKVVVDNFKSKFRLLGDISRTNRYGMTSDCVSDPVLKKYCFCKNYFKDVPLIQSAICNFVNC